MAEQRGGELLRGGSTPAVNKQQLVDMRALAFDETAGYMFNSSIGQSRVQQVFPTAAVASTNVITYDLAPTGSPADYYDFFSSYFSLDWTFVLPEVGTPAAVVPGGSFNLFHSLLLFSTVRLYLNGFELDDEAGNNQHIADFHKICIYEPQQGIGFIPAGAPGAGSFRIPQKVLETGIQSWPFIYAGQGYGDPGSGINRQIVAWQDQIQGAADSAAGAITTTYKPYQSLFLIKEFIPCSVRVRIELTKFSPTWLMATFSTALMSPFVPTLVQMTLYARIVTLTNQTYTMVSKLAMTMPFTYPVMRAQTTMFPIASGSQTVNIQVTGQRRPQVVILQAVLAANTLPGRVQSTNPFATTRLSTGQPNTLMKTSTLYLRCGAYRYPSLFDRTRSTAGSGTGGGTIQNDYDEYATLSYQFKDGEKLATQPFLSRADLETQQFSNLFFFNMSPQQETCVDRSVIETMNVTGTVEIVWQLQATTGDDIRLFVTTLTNEKVTVDMLSGRINKSW